MGAMRTTERARGSEDRPGPGAGGSVVAIGVFDGVHRGHQALIGRARGIADAMGLPLIAITFDPHPASVVPGRQAPPMLATVADRIRMLTRAGADEVVVLDFDERLAGMDPRTFVEVVLVDRLAARSVVVGENFRFGRGAAGDAQALRALGVAHGFQVSAMPLHPADAPWSSSRVRQALAAGEVAAAARILGRCYRLSGVVVHGDHRGRDLGYPTANLAWEGSPAIPLDGVYAGWVVPLPSSAPVDPGTAWPAAISVGTNPQFAGQDRRVEAYVLDRADLDLYGQQVGIDFLARLRGQETFASVDVLIAQMAQDVDQARELLADTSAVRFSGPSPG